MKSKNLAAALLSMLALISTSAFAGPPAKIDDLSWMTGSWAGALGPNTLEENWIKPTGGSIAAMVRMTGEGSTSMFEVITIEEVEGSLELHIQQWDAGFKPRTEAAQRMELTEIGERMVSFTAVSEGGMKTLGYTRPTDTTFDIHVENATGATFTINLEAF